MILVIRNLNEAAIMRAVRLGFLLTLVLIFSGSIRAAVAAASRPNIMIIMSDLGT